MEEGSAPPWSLAVLHRWFPPRGLLCVRACPCVLLGRCGVERTSEEEEDQQRLVVVPRRRTEPASAAAAAAAARFARQVTRSQGANPRVCPLSPDRYSTWEPEENILDARLFAAFEERWVQMETRHVHFEPLKPLIVS